MQLPVGVGYLLICFGRDEDQCRLIATVFQMSINCVMTKVCFAALEPFGKGWIAVIANFLGCLVPINLLGLFSPKSITILNGTLVEVCILTHGVS